MVEAGYDESDNSRAGVYLCPLHACLLMRSYVPGLGVPFLPGWATAVPKAMLP